MRSVILLFTGSKIMMNKTTLRWTLIALAIIAPLLIAWYIHYQREHFSCEAHTTIIDDNYVLDIIADYSFNGGEGTYETSGDYVQPGKPVVAISNKIAFNYWREAGSIIMVSTETNERPKKDQAYRLSIPDFYHVRDRGIRVQMTVANTSSYFISYGNVPVLYCTKG